MAYALHEVDEETDVGAYQAYLGAQSNSDLLDIAQHLDADHYPARLDAARREFRRRRVVCMPSYTNGEYALRNAALFGLALSAVTVALTLLLTPADAADPPWPAGIPEGAVVTHVARTYLTAMLRGAVVASGHLGLYALTLSVLGHGAVSGSIQLSRRRARADILRIVIFSWTAMVAAMMLAAAPWSAVPDLFTHSGDGPRALTLLNPFH